MDAPVWDVTVFTKNRDRLLRGDIARQFFQAVLAAREVKPLLSSEHFSVDGTLLGWTPKASTGLDEELSAEGRLRRAAWPGAKQRAGLSRREAEQRDARLDHRPR